MKYLNVVKGIFVSRPNRFVAQVLIDNIEETVHVKNTGRCEELLIEGVEVILEKASNPERKTKYDLIAVYREGYGWINIDSQAPNQVMKEWLENDNPIFKDVTLLKPEFKFRGSRIDFYLEKPKPESDDSDSISNAISENEDETSESEIADNVVDNIEKILIEVKGCTLVKEGVCFFPDAPTDRGVKHLRELTEAALDGYKCYIAFVIQINNLDYVFPNRETQPEFAVALREAVRAGVGILFMSTQVSEDELKIVNYRLISHP